MARHGHEVRLIAPRYVKPFVKRQKNDAADPLDLTPGASPGLVAGANVGAEAADVRRCRHAVIRATEL